jgi:TPR repeat protein
MRGFERWLGALVAALSLGCAAGAGRPVATASGSPSADARGCSDRNPLPCEAACDGGDGAACAIFGLAVEGMADAPVRLPQDLPRGRRALAQGCKLGNLDACRELASYDYDVGPAARACDRWEEICAKGDRRSCAYFGGCLLHEPGYRRDPARALRLFEDGCEHGERVSCRKLGALTEAGELVGRDPAAARALHAKACDLDDQPACVALAQALEAGAGGPPDPPRAKSLYRVACARGIRPVPCEALRRLGEEPPSTVVATGGAAEQVHVSTAYGYEWRIPANWEFVAPASVGVRYPPGVAEVVSAKVRGGDGRDHMTIVVTDVVEVIPGKAPDDNPVELDMLAVGVTRELKRTLGVEKVDVARFSMFGADAVRLDAAVGVQPKLYFTVSYFYRGRRRFEVRCVASSYQPGLPCRDAFGELVFHDVSEVLRESDRPHLLHLRDARFGLSFDAPDDGWLAIGPRTGLQGRQSVWIWNKEGRQIDVAALDASANPAAPDQMGMAAVMAEAFRKEGATTVVGASRFAGKPCAHVEVSRPSGNQQDLYVQRRGAIFYTVLVTAPRRDPALLEKARAGVKVDRSDSGP